MKFLFAKGHTVSEETRKKISAAHKGKHLSEEHRRKLSDVQTGRSRPLEIREKISNTMKAKGIRPTDGALLKSRSLESIKKRGIGISKYFTGRPLSEEHKAKLKEAKRGYKPTFGGKHHSGWRGGVPDAVRVKISNAALGHKVDEEARKKIRLARMQQRFPKTKTKPELKIMRLCQLYRLPYEYVGDGAFWIGNINPDFVDKKNRIALDVFGDYWHDPRLNPKVKESATESYRRKALKDAGWRLVILWEHEINIYSDALILSKIRRCLKCIDQHSI